MGFLDLLRPDSPASGPIGATAGAFVFVLAAYFFLQWDRNRTGSPNKDDTQIGLKLVLFGIIIAGVGILTGGLNTLLGFVLGGFKSGGMRVREAIPALIVGGGAVFVVLKLLLPRTNHAQYNQTARFTVGYLALVYGLMAVLHVYLFLLSLFTSGGWAMTSSELGATMVDVAIGFAALRSFGQMSGWVEPPPAAPAYGNYGGPSGPNMGVPGAGMPPGGSGGYGPPGGAPPGGGYGPPGGGGAPPGGGGYGPPGGGGAPPGGGGYGPPGGGGAPPGGGFGPGGGSGGGYPPR